MGSVYNRGTRDKPRWYIRFRDEAGKWVSRPSNQPTKAQARTYLAQVESRVAQGLVGIEERKAAPLIGPLMEDWLESLSNRNAADDRSRCRRHLLPEFKARRIDEVGLSEVMAWLDKQKAAKKLSAASIRHNLNQLSRFYSWAIERGHAQVNPVRQIPTGKRPQQSQKRDRPWLRDDALVATLMEALATPVDLMFYLGNRSGLRTGEIAGLRMNDFSFADEGVIRVRYSYGGPLKEDKNGNGKVKWVPCPDDWETHLGPWLEKRKEAKAEPEHLVFPGPRKADKPCRKEYIEGLWERAVENLATRKPPIEVGLTWYEATRHSFVSRNAEAGVPLDEISAAVGHSSPVVTRRYYDHFVRRSFSSALRTGVLVPEGDS